ncbi:16S rRNA pseudouridine516 synthase [Bacilli bacterium PM5-3]|nr:16S rRNA pseudouridine516 synthase [Bacilli bacterium PM5-3]
MRLDKLLAHSGFGTRKDVKKIIRSGLVEVNGIIIKNDDFKVDENNDEIIVDDFIVEYNKDIYLMMNKPKGYVCANHDRIHETVFDLIPEYNHCNLFCVGRLDIDTTGLLLITNDGAFSHSITKPKKKITKLYEAIVDGKIKSSDYEYFKKGVIIDDGYKCLPANLELIEEKTDYSIIRIEISEGKFHQIKKMVNAIGLNVLELKRLKIKDLELDSSLELGDYRLLDESEVKNLLHCTPSGQ